MDEEKQIAESYVAAGDVQFIFFPNLDGSQTATNIHVVAHCMGLQDPALFWAGHDHFYEKQGTFFRADEQTLIDTAVSLGADAAELEQCYFGGEGRQQVQALDAIVEERGIRGRPVFDINGTILFGAQPFETFANAIEASLGSQ